MNDCNVFFYFCDSVGLMPFSGKLQIRLFSVSVDYTATPVTALRQWGTDPRGGVRSLALNLVDLVLEGLN